MIGFSTDPKTNILLKAYPTYKLYGRIKEKDVAQYEESKDEKYILYKFCMNERSEEIPDYRAIIEQIKSKQRKEFLAERLAKGYKST